MDIAEYGRYVLRYGVYAAGATAAAIFSITWLAGVKVIAPAILLALVGFCIGPVFLAVNHTGYEMTAATSDIGAVTGGGAGRMASLSFIPGRERITLFLTGLGAYGLLVTVTILNLR